MRKPSTAIILQGAPYQDSRLFEQLEAAPGPKVCFVNGRASTWAGRRDELVEQVNSTRFFWCLCGDDSIEPGEFLRFRNVLSSSMASVEARDYFSKLVERAKWMVLPWGHSRRYPCLALFSSGPAELAELLETGSCGVPDERHRRTFRDPRRLWGYVAAQHRCDDFPFGGMRFVSLHGDQAVSELWENFAERVSISIFIRSGSSIQHHPVESRSAFEHVVALSQSAGETAVLAPSDTPAAILKRLLDLIEDGDSTNLFCISAVLELVDWCAALGRGDEAESGADLYATGDIIENLLRQMEASPVGHASVELYL